MARGFIGMAKATLEKFQFSVKVPETITLHKRLYVHEDAINDFEEFLYNTSHLKSTGKLGAILIRIPPSFTVDNFKNIELFLDRLSSNGYNCALYFRHNSWATKGLWEKLRHYNIAAVMTDSPSHENLEYLSEVIVTAHNSFIRFHGRAVGSYLYNYLYMKDELKPWIEKVDQARKQTEVLRIYFNNHYGDNAVVNALQL